jgi:hypothetical protein
MPGWTVSETAPAPIGGVTSAGFVDSSAEDFRLLFASPAMDAGRNVGLNPLFDFAEGSRPTGPKTLLGVYEYRSSNPDPAPRARSLMFGNDAPHLEFDR